MILNFHYSICKKEINMLKSYNCIPDFRGSLPKESTQFPTTGGSGVNGSIMAGDVFLIEKDVTFGKLKLKSGDYITAFVNRPGQRVMNWRAVRNEIKELIDDKGRII